MTRLTPPAPTLPSPVTTDKNSSDTPVGVRSPCTTEVTPGNVPRHSEGTMPRAPTFVLALPLLAAVTVGRSDECRADRFPDYRPVAGWPQLPPKVDLGPVSAVATDAKDRVFVAHRGPKPV